MSDQKANIDSSGPGSEAEENFLTVLHGIHKHYNMVKFKRTDYLLINFFFSKLRTFSVSKVNLKTR